MSIYLPIAEMSVNIFILFGMGAAVGFLSGMFGVGGGFLMTPLLIFYNIPPAVAVATEANQIVASSFSGALAHLRKGTVDVKLGMMLLVGGLIGSTIGVWAFSALRSVGQLDLIISILYVVFLGSIGTLMTIESLRAIKKARDAGGEVKVKRPGHDSWIHALPLKMRFRKSKLYLSAIPVVVLGAFVGVLAAIMGVGGGFIMVPAMIYLLRVPTNVVIGTSLFQIIFVTAYTTIIQSTTNQTVDVVLAFILMVGGVIGAQMGAAAGHKLKGEQLRALLGLLVLAVCIRLGYDLVVTPSDFFSVIGTADQGGH
ncbi:MAG: sulfite exporter TauE/SafE family protein [Pseudomonadota bacterium]